MTSRSGICINLLMCGQKVCTATTSMHLLSGDINPVTVSSCSPNVIDNWKVKTSPYLLWTLCCILWELYSGSCVMAEADSDLWSPGEEYRVWGYGCMVATKRPRTSSQLCMSKTPQLPCPLLGSHCWLSDRHRQKRTEAQQKWTLHKSNYVGAAYTQPAPNLVLM